MPQTYTNPKNDRRSLTHTGTELGADNVVLNENATGREDRIISWECPRKYEAITYSAGRHITKFIPRTRKSASGDGSQTTFDTQANIQPPAGEPQMADMPYPPVVAYDTAAGAKLTVADYDFDGNTVTFESAPTSGSSNVLMWPVVTEGVIKFQGYDQFDNAVAALDQWGIPIRVFNDFDQERNITQIHLTGAATWEESEKLVLSYKGPHTIAWQDADYPEGEYASTIEQRVDVDV